MQTEKILHKGKTVYKQTKKNGTVRYAAKAVYLGLDSKTGKPVRTTITASTLRQLDRKTIQAKFDFVEGGATRHSNQQFQISTFKDLAEAWYYNFELMVSSDNTLNRVRNYLDTYIIPQFGDYVPDKIEPIDIQVWVNHLAEKYKNSVRKGYRKSAKGSAKDYGAIVKKMGDIFNFGITNYGLTKNPVLSVQIPPQPLSNRKRVKVLHDEDLIIWLKYLDELPATRANRRFKLICDTLLASGLRINELLALSIYDLDFDNSLINVNKTLIWRNAKPEQGKKGEVICKESPKTAAGNRKVYVPFEILEQLQNFHDEMNLYFRKNGLEKSKLIFPTIYGNYMCDRNERTTLKKRLIECGLPDYGFHLFRHTHASMMLNAGMNWKELQVRMGHKSIGTTMDTYAELAPQKLGSAVEIYNKKMLELRF